MSYYFTWSLEHWLPSPAELWTDVPGQLTQAMFFKSQQNPTKQNYQKQTKYTFTESRRLNQAIMNQKTTEISNGQSALSYASKVIPKVHSSYFKFFSEKDKIMAIPYFHSIFSSDCQQS
jgi:hypothetical protein